MVSGNDLSFFLFFVFFRTLVDFLLANGARPEAKNRDGLMPLQIALNGGHLKTMKVLQRHMANKLRQDAEQLLVTRNRYILLKVKTELIAFVSSGENQTVSSMDTIKGVKHI